MRFFVFFAPEGAGGEAALATPATSGGQQQAAQASQQPAGTQQAPVAQAQEESFESLIEGKYKQDFQKRVQGIVRDRLKGQKQQLDRLTPVLDTLGQLYGVELPAARVPAPEECSVQGPPPSAGRTSAPG